MEVDKLLPIGSVVRLNGADKRLMIFGIKQTVEAADTSADYIGVLYPEGNIDAQHRYLFNHEAIEEVIFRGFEDNERDTFIERLMNFFEKGS